MNGFFVVKIVKIKVYGKKAFFCFDVQGQQKQTYHFYFRLGLSDLWV